MRYAAIFGAILTLLASDPVVAQTATPFSPPEGCRLTLTVQERSCSVGLHYICNADPDGDQRVIYFGKGGVPRFISHIDREARWLWSHDPQSGLIDELVEDARDDASLSTLLKTGRDEFDFWTESNDGERLHHVGFDELTGESVTIDGVALEQTRFELTTSDAEGRVLIRRKGQQFVSREHGRFYGGPEQSEDWTGATRRDDNTPVQFLSPGDAGFASTEPQFGCESLIVALPEAAGAG